MIRFRLRFLSACLALCGASSSCGLVPSSLPVYSFDQTDSAHAGCRRSTITSGQTVYVNDLEEQVLRLMNPYPRQAVGRSGFGNSKICAIEGQDPAAYLAADMGSEMPAYYVFRNEKQPPFDWRRATFQKMRLDGLETTDPALIAEVLGTLRDDPAPPPFPVETPIPNSSVHSALLFSDQLPGMAFSPFVYFDRAGPVYLAEHLASIEFKGSNELIRANWIPARTAFAQWSKAADRP